MDRADTATKCTKNKNARVKRAIAKQLFFVAKYANMWLLVVVFVGAALSSILSQDKGVLF